MPRCGKLAALRTIQRAAKLLRAKIPPYGVSRFSTPEYRAYEILHNATVMLLTEIRKEGIYGRQ